MLYRTKNAEVMSHAGSNPPLKCKYEIHSIRQWDRRQAARTSYPVLEVIVLASGYARLSRAPQSLSASANYTLSCLYTAPCCHLSRALLNRLSNDPPLSPILVHIWEQWTLFTVVKLALQLIKWDATNRTARLPHRATTFLTSWIGRSGPHDQTQLTEYRQPEREADSLSPFRSTVEIMNMCSYIATPPTPNEDS